MSLGRGLLFRHSQQVAPPARPSTFGKDVSERTVQPQEEYATGEDGDFTLDTPDDYGYPEYDDQPVGVYVTAPIPSERPLNEWSAATLTVDLGIVSQIVGGDRNRSRMVVRNLGDTNTVYLTRENGDLAMVGYALPPGADVEFQHNSPMYAHVTAGATEISYVVERTVENVE
jgi:hypothetical protein